MDLKKIIDKRADAAQYMIDEITHICKDFEKRDPGSKGELQACEYMADVLKNDCGCETAEVESFKDLFYNLVCTCGCRIVFCFPACIRYSYCCWLAYRIYGVWCV